RAQPDLTAAQFARARAYQRSNQWAQAMAEYRKLSDQAPDGPTSACEGYCLNRQGFDGKAEPCYETAIARGFATAAVYNNLGYCYLRRTKQLEAAKANMDRALDLDLGMQAAWHNRAMYALQMSFYLQMACTEPRGSRPPDLAEKV